LFSVGRRRAVGHRAGTVSRMCAQLSGPALFTSHGPGVLVGLTEQEEAVRESRREIEPLLALGDRPRVDQIAELRSLFAAPDPVSRIDRRSGELAQCDLWFPPIHIPVGADQIKRPRVMVMG